VRAKPLAALDRDREVLFVWFRAAHPAAPADETPEPAAAAALALQPVVVAPMATTPAAAAPAPTPAAAPAPTTSAVQPMGATP
jgi:hypothetical protein